MRVVIDTDTGVDDAIAIMMALNCLPEGSVLGITTVFGNVELHQTNHNVAYLLRAMKKVHIPVYHGASKAIVSSVSLEKWKGHGPDGLGGQAGLVQAPLQAARQNEAVHALIEQARDHKGELVVVGLGPLTNIALATLIDPFFLSNIKMLVVMGGLSRGEGNMTEHAEFNVGCDPEATKIIYEHCSADKLYVLPFETSMDYGFTWEEFDELFDKDHHVAHHIKKIWGYSRELDPSQGFVPCDAYAIAMLMHPEYVIMTKTLRGTIHLDADSQRGANIWEEAHITQANVTLITEVDKKIFSSLLQRLMCP